MFMSFTFILNPVFTNQTHLAPPQSSKASILSPDTVIDWVISDNDDSEVLKYQIAAINILGFLFPDCEGRD